MAVVDQNEAGVRFGLRAKFVLAFATSTVLIAVILLLLQQYLVRRAMIRQTVEQGSAIARAIEATAGYYVIFGLTDDLKAIVTKLANNQSVAYAAFLDGSGKVLASSRAEVPEGLLNRPLRKEDGALAGDNLHIYTVEFFETNEATGKPKGYFRLILNQSQAETALAALRNWNIVITALVLALASLLAWFASQYIVRPILALVTTARQIAKGDLTQRADVGSGDEIGSLADAFNAMAGDLEKTVKNLIQSQTKLKSVVETVDSRSHLVISRVDEQRAVIDETYNSIDQLNNGVRKITDNVEALSASSEETSSSMLEMVASMEEVSRHTDTLFTSVEDTASATHQMVSSISEVDQNVVYLVAGVASPSAQVGRIAKRGAACFQLRHESVRAAVGGRVEGARSRREVRRARGPRHVGAASGVERDGVAVFPAASAQIAGVAEGGAARVELRHEGVAAAVVGRVEGARVVGKSAEPVLPIT